MSARFQPGLRPLCAIALVFVVGLLAACGSSSSTPSATTTTATSVADGDAQSAATGDAQSAAAGDAQNAAAGAARNALTRSRAHRTRRARPDPVSSGVIVHKPQHGTGGAESNDDNPSRADVGHQASTAGNPCALVSRGQARVILGKAIEPPVQAPLGPTCIYRPVGAKRFVTLAVESLDFASVRTKIRNRTQLDVAGRTAYCGAYYGQPTIFVPLAAGRVLTVAASCTIGAKFAAKAVPRLHT